MPGMSIRVRVVTSDPYKALLVPETAVFPDPANGFHFAVFIVSDQNLVQSREIKAGQRDDDSIVVEKALTADDWVIENEDLGQGRWKVGMTIKPLKPPAAPPSFSNGKPSAAAELKVYGGKTFDQWREIAQDRAHDDLRVKAFAALGAFARNGKSDEAAAAIIEALKVNQSSVALIAAYGTLRMAGPQGEAAIKSGIRDKDPGHRRAAIEVLGVRRGRGGRGGRGGGGGESRRSSRRNRSVGGRLGEKYLRGPRLDRSPRRSGPWDSQQRRPCVGAHRNRHGVRIQGRQTGSRSPRRRNRCNHQGRRPGPEQAAEGRRSIGPGSSGRIPWK